MFKICPATRLPFVISHIRDSIYEPLTLSMSFAIIGQTRRKNAYERGAARMSRCHNGMAYRQQAVDYPQFD